MALPPSEAFRIEYWALEEAKIRRQPPEKELSRRSSWSSAEPAGSGAKWRSMAAERGAHVVVADRELGGAAKVARRKPADRGQGSRRSRRQSIFAIGRRFVSALRPVVAIWRPGHPGEYGGDFPSSPDGAISDEQWASTLEVNVTANYLLADEAAKIFDARDWTRIVLTSSANAVVAKSGSEAYDVSKAAVSHLVGSWRLRFRRKFA